MYGPLFQYRFFWRDLLVGHLCALCNLFLIADNVEWCPDGDLYWQGAWTPTSSFRSSVQVFIVYQDLTWVSGYTMHFNAFVWRSCFYQSLTSFWSWLIIQDGNPRRWAANCKTSKCAGKLFSSRIPEPVYPKVIFCNWCLFAIWFFRTSDSPNVRNGTCVLVQLERQLNAIYNREEEERIRKEEAAKDDR